ncbi:MAG: hypothetical protein JWR21_2616 [Herminiimonas sp.]|nr:hypothetical protein [Herminiimonas sp.]
MIPANASLLGTLADIPPRKRGDFFTGPRPAARQKRWPKRWIVGEASLHPFPFFPKYLENGNSGTSRFPKFPPRITKSGPVREASLVPSALCLPGLSTRVPSRHLGKHLRESNTVIGRPPAGRQRRWPVPLSSEAWLHPFPFFPKYLENGNSGTSRFPKFPPRITKSGRVREASPQPARYVFESIAPSNRYTPRATRLSIASFARSRFRFSSTGIAVPAATIASSIAMPGFSPAASTDN